MGLLLVAAVTVQACTATPFGGMGRGGMGQMGGGMMGGGMMGGGEGRSRENAPSPQPDATETRVVAGDLFFKPDELHLKAGQTVNLTLDNQGAILHDLTIGELDFALVAAPGTSSSGALTVSEPGRYDFICSVPGHAQAGMTGTLIVE